MIASYATIRNHFFAHRSDRVGTTPPPTPVKRRAEPEPPPVEPIEPPPLPVPVEDIVRAVCTEFEVKRAKLLSVRRTKDVVAPRQIAFSLCKYLTLRTLPEIGRRFGRDHTTVLHGIRKMAAALDATKVGMPDEATPAQWVRVMREHMGI
jgi:hypothetical protein